MESKLKQCTKCGRFFEKNTENFRRQEKNLDGLQNQCKMCANLRDADRYDKKSMELKIRASIWNKKNKEARAKINKDFYQKNKDIIE